SSLPSSSDSHLPLRRSRHLCLEEVFVKTSVLSVILLVVSLPAVAEKSGKLEGTIVGRDDVKNELTVRHPEVKGVMGAMTMGYQVRGQKVSALPANGTKITATVHENNGVYWLTDVEGYKSPQMSMGTEHQHMNPMPQPMPPMQHPMPMPMPKSMPMQADPTGD